MCQWYHYQIFRYFSSLIEILLHKRFVTNSLRLNINLSIIAKWSNDLLLLSCLYPQRRNAKQNPSKILFYNTFNFLMYKKFSSLHFRHAQSINKMSFALKIFVWLPSFASCKWQKPMLSRRKFMICFFTPPQFYFLSRHSHKLI